MHPDNPANDADAQAFGPSRSAQRRDALEVLDLAAQLVELPPSRLARFELPDDVLEEIANVRRISAHVARKRQLAYLAKLMRRHDAEIFAAARAGLGENRERQHEEAAALHRLEALRERLLEVGDAADAALGEFITSHPSTDRQHLRALIRQARIERANPAKPPKACRELFRVLRTAAEDGAPSGD